MEHRWVDSRQERATPGGRPPKSINSLERDVLRLAVGFMVLAIIGCGAAWLSKRQYETVYNPTYMPSP